MPKYEWLVSIRRLGIQYCLCFYLLDIAVQLTAFKFSVRFVAVKACIAMFVLSSTGIVSKESTLLLIMLTFYLEVTIQLTHLRSGTSWYYHH